MRFRQKIKCFVKNESGVSATEFALISIPLILLIFGIIEFGRAIQIRNEVERSFDIAAREFEVNGFRGAFTGSNLSCTAQKTQIEDRFIVELTTGPRPALIPNPNNLSVLVTCGTNEYIDIETTYNFSPSIPFFDQGTIDLSVSRLVLWP